MIRPENKIQLFMTLCHLDFSEINGTITLSLRSKREIDTFVEYWN